MKCLIFLLLLFSLSASAQVYEVPHLRTVPPSLSHSSRGFRLGTIIKVADEGMFFWRYRYEGKILLGSNTIQGELYDTHCVAMAREKLRNGQKMEKQDEMPQTSKPEKEQITEILEEDRKHCIIENPMPFSFFPDSLYKTYLTYGQGPVVIYYERPLVSLKAAFADTKTFLQGLWHVDESLPIPRSKTISGGISGDLTSEKGSIDGRIVGASVEGVVRDTYEIIIQLGDSGNNFQRMSLSDSDLFDYVVQCMLTGKMLRIDYEKLLGALVPLSDLRGYWTSYRITGVSIP